MIQQSQRIARRAVAGVIISRGALAASQPLAPHRRSPRRLKRLERHGFKPEDGNYIRYVETEADPSYVLITAWDGTNVALDEAVLVGFYDLTDTKIATLRFLNVAAFLDSLQED